MFELTGIENLFFTHCEKEKQNILLRKKVGVHRIIVMVIEAHKGNTKKKNTEKLLKFFANLLSLTLQRMFESFKSNQHTQ